MDRRILVVDDSQLVCQQLSQVLASPDRQITVAPDGTAAMEWLVENRCSLVLTDLRLPGMNGLDLIRAIQERELPVTVIVMTGYATVEAAVEAMKLGAYDLILKPIDTIRLEVVVSQALEDRRLIDEVADLRGRLRRKFAYHNLLGRSPRMTEVFDRVARVASSPCNVLVTGETGTGKELVAQAIHFSDVTRQGTLLAVNCAALARAPAGDRALRPRTRGVHRGRPPEERAVRAGQGRDALPRRDRRHADGHAGQAACACSRTGGSSASAAPSRSRPTAGSSPPRTSTSPRPSPPAGSARTCIYRLNVFSIELPPLRDRLEDVPILVKHFLEKLTERGLPSRTVSRLALSRLLSYDWPGNVRELEHVLEQAMVTTPGPVIEPENLPPQIVARHDEPFTLDFDHRRPLPEITAEFTRRIECATSSACWRSTAAGSSCAPGTAGCRGGASARSSAATRSTSAPSSPTPPGASNSPWRASDIGGLNRAGPDDSRLAQVPRPVRHRDDRHYPAPPRESGPLHRAAPSSSTGGGRW